MPDGRKRILSPFGGHKKRKAWNKTREKYMPVKKDKIQQKQTGDLITKRNGQKNSQTVKVHFTMVMKIIMMMRVIMKIMNRRSYWRVLPMVATKQFHQFFYKN